MNVDDFEIRRASVGDVETRRNSARAPSGRVPGAERTEDVEDYVASNFNPAQLAEQVSDTDTLFRWPGGGAARRVREAARGVGSRLRARAEASGTGPAVFRPARDWKRARTRTDARLSGGGRASRVRDNLARGLGAEFEGTAVLRKLGLQTGGHACVHLRGQSIRRPRAGEAHQRRGLRVRLN